MRRPLAILCSLALIAAVSACGSDEEKQTTPGKQAKTATATQPRPATTAARRPAGPPRCRKVAAPRPKRPVKLRRPTLRLDRDKAYDAVVRTSCGTFAIALDVKGSPLTSASFASLARHGFFNGTTFHRIVPGFVIQGGDPQGTGEGGPGYSVVEPPPADVRYTKGVVAMAKTQIEDPGTSGSQFYVVTADDAQLPAEYAVLGRVTAGQNVVDVIGVVPTDQGNPDPSRRERPVTPVVIRSVRIVERKK